MRGEHFLLLAEREQLLAPVVLVQLRQILAQQTRPATGEAIARLLVERGYLRVEQARHVIGMGASAGSPLVPQLAASTSPLGQVASRTAPSHHSDELLLAPDKPKADTRQISQATTKISAPPVQPTSNRTSARSPVNPTEAELVELSDSFRQLMELPGTLDWRSPPSPLFARRFQVTTAMVLYGMGGVILLLLLLIVVALRR